MTVFLIIIVIALFAVTLWQMSKIFQLSKSDHEDSSEVATNKDNKLNAYLLLGFLIFFYLLTIYCFWEYSDFYLPKAASAHGGEIDRLLFITIGLIMFVQIITQGLLFYFSYKYHGRKGQRALFYADNDKLEFIWTIIPVIVLAGLIIYGLFTWTDIMNINEEDDPMVVELYAYQFAWRARYSGEDNTLGGANVRYIEGINQLGIDESDAYGKDDIITTELHLPVGKPVLFKFRSQDVLHSAYFPHFRAQMNVVPGMITRFQFTPIITSEEMRESDYMQEKVQNINRIRTDKNKDLILAGEPLLDPYEFEYYLLCNKICGQGHYNMQMKIVVESQVEYDKWLATQEKFGVTMANQKENDAATNSDLEDNAEMQQQPVQDENDAEDSHDVAPAILGEEVSEENEQN